MFVNERKESVRRLINSTFNTKFSGNVTANLRINDLAVTLFQKWANFPQKLFRWRCLKCKIGFLQKAAFKRTIIFLKNAWCRGYHYCATSFNKAGTQVLRRFKFCLRRVGDSWWWGSLLMAGAGNKAKFLCRSTIPQKQFIMINHHHQRIYWELQAISLKTSFLKTFADKGRGIFRP